MEVVSHLVAKIKLWKCQLELKSNSILFYFKLLLLQNIHMSIFIFSWAYWEEETGEEEQILHAHNIFLTDFWNKSQIYLQKQLIIEFK